MLFMLLWILCGEMVDFLIRICVVLIDRLWVIMLFSVIFSLFELINLLVCEL